MLAGQGTGEHAAGQQPGRDLIPLLQNSGVGNPALTPSGTGGPSGIGQNIIDPNMLQN